MAAGKHQARQVVRLVFGDGGFDDHAGIVGEGGGQVDAAQHRVERPAGDGFAAVEQYQMVGQAGNLVGGVADVDDGDRQFAVQAFQIGQDFQLAPVVESGQRFVHQQDPWRGEQGAGDGDALALAA